jgi:hypothetical protein
MSRRLFIIALLALAWWFASGQFVHAQKFYTWHQYGGTGTDLGRMQAVGDWPAHVGSQWIQDQFKWAGPDAGAALHLPFGYWATGAMEVDSLDFAAASAMPWGDANEFVKAWFMEARKRPLVAYVGNAAMHPRLVNMNIDKFRSKVRRCVDPFQEAGFRQVVVDAAYDALSKPAKLPPPAKPEWPGDTLDRGPNRDTEVLKIVDGLFPKRAGIEVGPRRFAGWEDLQARDAWFIERDYQRLHGSDAQLVQGWGKDTSYLKGRVHRILLAADFGNDAKKVVERAREIVKAGHVPVVQAWWLDQQKVKPADFLEAK